MKTYESQFVEVATLLGDKARATMLWCMLDGRAYTATELATCADISPQAASNHLKKLLEADFLFVEKQGKHRYFRYRSPEVAQVIESMASLITFKSAHKHKILPSQSPLTQARTCYDHLAGKFGVSLTQALVQKQVITLQHKNYEVTSIGKCWFKELEIDVDSLKLKKRKFAYPCLDWSERKYHLAGALGAALLQALLDSAWIKKKAHSREIIITPKGKIALRDRLNLGI